jgi:hypothetical protein
MSATVTSAVPQDQPPVGGFGRIVGIFTSPTKTFQDIVRRPSWVLPVIVMTLISIALNVTLAKHADWTAVTRQQIEQNRMTANYFEKMQPDQRDAAYQRQAVIGQYTRYVRGMVGTLLLVVIMAAIYLAAFNVLAGARIKYSMALALTSFAALPLAVKDLLGIPIILLKDPSAINPENFIASNLAALLPSNAPIWQQVLAGSVDVFGIWVLILTAIAFTTANPRKLTLGKSLRIIIGLQVLIILFFTGIAAVFA